MRELHLRSNLEMKQKNFINQLPPHPQLVLLSSSSRAIAKSHYFGTIHHYSKGGKKFRDCRLAFDARFWVAAAWKPGTKVHSGTFDVNNNEQRAFKMSLKGSTPFCGKWDQVLIYDFPCRLKTQGHAFLSSSVTCCGCSGIEYERRRCKMSHTSVQEEWKGSG